MKAGFVNKSRIRQLAVLAICAAPVVLAVSRAGQQRQTDLPAAQPDLQPGQADIFERPRDRAEADRQRALHPGPVTEEEWEKAREFLKVHSPKRLDAIREVSGEPREGLKHFLVTKWHSIVQLQSQSQDLYNTRVREVELDDAVFGICQELKHNHANAKLQADLNSKIAELFNLGLTERKQRIGLVEKSLGDQKKSLDSDEHDKTRLIQQQYEIVLAHGVEGARFDGPRRTNPNSNSKSKPGDSTTPTSPGDDESSD